LADEIASVTVERDESGVAVVVVRGDVDLSNADDVGRALMGAFDDLAEDLGIVDVRGVSYIDSQGLRVLHQLALRLSARGERLTVVAPERSIAGDVIRLTGMDSYVTVVDEPLPPDRRG
jgi:anti-anti-sigma factor